MLNAFTVDVEDYFQVSGFERDIDRSTWDDFEHRVVANTSRMLDLLAEHDVTATFFVLGWTARKFPDLVCRIDTAGHEIASHGYWHRLVYSQTPDEFRQDNRQSRDLLCNIIGKPVTAYRAPSFSITHTSAWALEADKSLSDAILSARHGDGVRARTVVVLSAWHTMDGRQAPLPDIDQFSLSPQVL